MLFGLGLADTDIWEELAFRRRSKQLADLARDDFASIPNELAKAFPHTKGLQDRYVPVVSKFVNELSGIYSRPVVRTFQGAGKEQAAKMAEVYRDSKVNQAFAAQERMVWHQNTALMLVLPDRDNLSQVQPQVVAPYQCEVTLGPSRRAADPRSWKKLEVAVPMYTLGLGSAVTMGTMVLTPDEAYIQYGGTKEGIYNDACTNPLKRIPVVVVRRTDPAPGRPFGPVNEPLLNLQVAVCLQDSDTELLVHTQAWGQRVIENADIGQQVEEIVLGKDKVLALVKTDQTNPAPGPKLSIVQGQPPISEIVGWQESRLRQYCAMLGLDPSVFLRVNTSTTATAKMFSEQARREIRDRIRPQFVEAEQEVARLVAETLNLSDILELPPKMSVVVRWQEWTPSLDPAQEANALETLVRISVVGIVDYVAERDGLTLDEAREKVARWRKENTVQPAADGKDPVEGAPEGGQPVAEQAMNGAQVTSLLEIISQVATGQLPAEAAILVIEAAFPTLALERIRTMVSSAAAFEPAPKDVPPPPFGKPGEPSLPPSDKSEDDSKNQPDKSKDMSNKSEDGDNKSGDMSDKSEDM